MLVRQNIKCTIIISKVYEVDSATEEEAISLISDSLDSTTIIDKTSEYGEAYCLPFLITSSGTKEYIIDGESLDILGPDSIEVIK